MVRTNRWKFSPQNMSIDENCHALETGVCVVHRSDTLHIREDRASELPTLPRGLMAIHPHDTKAFANAELQHGQSENEECVHRWRVYGGGDEQIVQRTLYHG